MPVRHLGHLVISVAESSRVDLKKVLTGKLCYLKMDAGTRRNRNFLAINVQLYDEKKNKVVKKHWTLLILKSGESQFRTIRNQ